MQGSRLNYEDTKRWFYKDHEAVMRASCGMYFVCIYENSEEYCVNKLILPVATLSARTLDDAVRASEVAINKIVANRSLVDSKEALKKEKRELMREIRSYARIFNFLTETQVAMLEKKAARIGEIDAELERMKSN